MSTSRRGRGFATEDLVAAAFAADGFPQACAATRGAAGRDILNLVGVCCEVKARTRFDPLAALRQAITNAGDDVPLVVMRPNGCGPATIDYWPAFTPFGVQRRLLRLAGYGDALPEAA